MDLKNSKCNFLFFFKLSYMYWFCFWPGDTRAKEEAAGRIVRSRRDSNRWWHCSTEPQKSTPAITENEVKCIGYSLYSLNGLISCLSPDFGFFYTVHLKYGTLLWKDWYSPNSWRSRCHPDVGWCSSTPRYCLFGCAGPLLAPGRRGGSLSPPAEWGREPDMLLQKENLWLWPYLFRNQTSKLVCTGLEIYNMSDTVCSMLQVTVCKCY